MAFFLFVVVFVFAFAFAFAKAEAKAEEEGEAVSAAAASPRYSVTLKRLDDGETADKEHSLESIAIETSMVRLLLFLRVSSLQK